MQQDNTKAVFFNGPFSYIDPVEGIERPYYTVFVGIDLDSPIGKVYTIWDFYKAQDLALKMSNDRNLPLESDAITP